MSLFLESCSSSIFNIFISSMILHFCNNKSYMRYKIGWSWAYQIRLTSSWTVLLCMQTVRHLMGIAGVHKTSDPQICVCKYLTQHRCIHKLCRHFDIKSLSRDIKTLSHIEFWGNVSLPSGYFVHGWQSMPSLTLIFNNQFIHDTHLISVPCIRSPPCQPILKCVRTHELIGFIREHALQWHIRTHTWIHTCIFTNHFTVKILSQRIAYCCWDGGQVTLACSACQSNNTQQAGERWKNTDNHSNLKPFPKINICLLADSVPMTSGKRKECFRDIPFGLFIWSWGLNHLSNIYFCGMSSVSRLEGVLMKRVKAITW